MICISIIVFRHYITVLKHTHYIIPLPIKTQKYTDTPFAILKFFKIAIITNLVNFYFNHGYILAITTLMNNNIRGNTSIWTILFSIPLYFIFTIDNKFILQPNLVNLVLQKMGNSITASPLPFAIFMADDRILFILLIKFFKCRP